MDERAGGVAQIVFLLEAEDRIAQLRQANQPIDREGGNDEEDGSVLFSVT